MNMVEQAYADIEARRQEAPRGTFVRPEGSEREDVGGEREAVVSGLGQAAPPRLQGLSGREFPAFFSSDNPTQIVPFTVEGHAAWVGLRKMTGDEYTSLMEVFTRIARQVKTQDGIPEVALVTEMNRYAVSRTVVSGELPRRREGDAWAMERVPDSKDDRIRLLLALDCSPEVWDGLVHESLALYGLAATQEGN